MTAVYTLLVKAVSPVSLPDMKTFLKVFVAADDTVIQGILDTATDWGESYTGRDFRANSWELLLDEFTDPIILNRNPVDSITSVEHLVSAAYVAVTATDYYLKKLVQSSEILLVVGKSWPTNTDDREQAIKVEFLTEFGLVYQDRAIDAIKRHVSFMYSNRSDCPDITEAAFEAGSAPIYDQFRIARI